MNEDVQAPDTPSLDPGTELLVCEVSNGIATLTLNRPKVNALNMELQSALGRVAGQIAARDDIAAVVLTGSARAFAAGVDIAELQQCGYAEMARWIGHLHDAFTAVARIPQPVVAAVSGYALGGGCELAMCADVRFAATNAVFGQPEIKLGVIPGAGGSQRLARLVGPAVAKDLIFTGRNVDADEALRIGLVNRLVEPDALLEEARAWAQQFVGGAALALKAAKACVDYGLDAGIDAGLALERAEFAGLFGSADAQAGLTSFLENGPGKASFSGR